jgi:hypothetical protein
MSLLVIGLILEGAFWLFNLVSVAHRELALRSLLFPILAVVAGYQNWRRSRINSTVDDALKRRDMANAQITNNPELLRPYVGSALLDSPNAPATDRDNSMETKIDMYIYNEIDNLEFVFDKANHNLIDDVFIMRAIKIFIARNENPLFRSRSVVLLTKGRYNHDFRFAAETLILVGEWRSKLTGIRP